MAEVGKLNVNFLRKQRKAVSVLVARDQTIARYTSFGLIGFMAIIIIAVLLHVVILNMQKNIEKQSTAAQQNIQAMSSIERDYIVFVKKVKLLYTLDQQKQSKRKTTAFFYGLIPKDDVLLSTQIDDKKDEIEFQVQTPDVFHVTDLLKLFFADSVKQQGYEIVVKSLDRKTAGRYIVNGTLKFVLPGEK